jgi:hypothetical protein
MLKKTECWSLCLKDDVVLRYCSFNNLKKCNPTPILHNLYKSASLQTEWVKQSDSLKITILPL